MFSLILVLSSINRSSERQWLAMRDELQRVSALHANERAEQTEKLMEANTTARDAQTYRIIQRMEQLHDHDLRAQGKK